MTSKSVLSGCILAILMTVSGCADNKPPSYYAPAPLQDLRAIPAGMGALYLLRAPHDGSTIRVSLEGHAAFPLPASSYVIINLRPGFYELGGNKEDHADQVITPIKIMLIEGKRTFAYTSIQSIRGPLKISMEKARNGNFGTLTIDHPMIPNDGNFTWTECSELDAQGLISISKEWPVGRI